MCWERNASATFSSVKALAIYLCNRDFQSALKSGMRLLPFTYENLCQDVRQNNSQSAFSSLGRIDMLGNNQMPHVKVTK